MEFVAVGAVFFGMLGAVIAIQTYAPPVVQRFLGRVVIVAGLCSIALIVYLAVTSDPPCADISAAERDICLQDLLDEGPNAVR